MKFPNSALLLIELVVLLLCASLIDGKESDYIVGGTNAAKNEFPYQVSLQYKKHHICGGSILNNCSIITAAHCVVKYPRSTLSILAGTTKLNSGGVRVDIQKLIPHENFNNRSLANDIALIKLKTCLTLNKENIKAVELLLKNIGGGVIGIVSGWGYTDKNASKTTNDLKKLGVRTITIPQCKRTFRGLPDGDICTLNVVGQGTCNGDSGGPLVEAKSKKQMGLVSTGIPCAKGYPDIYTSIDYFQNWIAKNLN